MRFKDIVCAMLVSLTLVQTAWAELPTEVQYTITWGDKLKEHFQWYFRRSVWDNTDPNDPYGTTNHIISHNVSISDRRVVNVMTIANWDSIKREGRIRMQPFVNEMKPIGFEIKSPEDAIAAAAQAYSRLYMFDNASINAFNTHRFKSTENLHKRARIQFDTNYVIPRYSWRDYEDFVVPVESRDGTHAVFVGLANSIARAHELPMKYRPWAATYTYRQRPDRDITPVLHNDFYAHNSDGVFIYVYDENDLRARVDEWALHDRILYGLKPSPADKHVWEYERSLRTLEVKEYLQRKGKGYSAELEYGPMVDDPNDEMLRAMRVDLHYRTVYAKQYLARSLHPAPEWIENGYGDYTYDEDDSDVPQRARRFAAMLYRYTYAAYPNLDAIRLQVVRDIQNSNIYDYWAYYETALPEPMEAIELARQYDHGKATLSQVREAVRRCELAVLAATIREAMRIQPASRATYEEDYRRYFSNDRLSVALWMGSDSTGKVRHRNVFSLKTLFPNFEGKNRPGELSYNYGKTTKRIGRIITNYEKWLDLLVNIYGRGKNEVLLKENASLNSPRNRNVVIDYTYHGYSAFPIGVYRDVELEGHWLNRTGGLAYAGHVTDKKELARLLASHKNMHILWRNALKGPAFIVSKSSYERYGHKHFETWTNRPLVKVDVTGAMVQAMCMTMSGATKEEIATHVNEPWAKIIRLEKGKTSMMISIPQAMAKPTARPRYADHDLVLPIGNQQKEVDAEYERTYGEKPDMKSDAYIKKVALSYYQHPIFLKYHKLNPYTSDDIRKAVDLVQKLRKAREEDEKEYPGLSFLRIIELHDYLKELWQPPKATYMNVFLSGPAHTVSTYIDARKTLMRVWEGRGKSEMRRFSDYEKKLFPYTRKLFDEYGHYVYEFESPNVLMRFNPRLAVLIHENVDDLTSFLLSNSPGSSTVTPSPPLISRYDNRSNGAYRVAEYLKGRIGTLEYYYLESFPETQWYNILPTLSMSQYGSMKVAHTQEAINKELPFEMRKYATGPQYNTWNSICRSAFRLKLGDDRFCFYPVPHIASQGKILDHKGKTMDRLIQEYYSRYDEGGSSIINSISTKHLRQSMGIALTGSDCADLTADGAIYRHYQNPYIRHMYGDFTVSKPEYYIRIVNSNYEPSMWSLAMAKLLANRHLDGGKP